MTAKTKHPLMAQKKCEISPDLAISLWIPSKKTGQGSVGLAYERFRNIKLKLKFLDWHKYKKIVQFYFTLTYLIIQLFFYDILNNKLFRFLI